MKAFYFEGSSGEKLVEKEIPKDLVELCKEKKLELISTLGEHEPDLEEYFLNEDINVPEDLMKSVIRKLTIEKKFVPVFMGSAFKNKGV